MKDNVFDIDVRYWNNWSSKGKYIYKYEWNPQKEHKHKHKTVKLLQKQTKTFRILV